MDFHELTSFFGGLVLGALLSIPWLIGAVIHYAGAPAHRLRERREKQGQCLQCGYDLRGSRKKCSECGLPFWRFGD